jgi:2-keto-4-pentenoate hydratase/2-oxohepta-3-ene-1,7-dioic acid hydratase in catechol pathway
VIAIGMNYRDHCLEQGIEPPVEPQVFAKLPSSIIGPDVPVSWPADVVDVDWEVELAVVIGSPDAAGRPTVAGYTIANDVSARDLQFRDVQFVRGKSIDTFCPMGPWLVTPDDLPDPLHVALSMHVNGIEMQGSNTNQLLFDVPTLLSFCAHYFTLEPGDIILTGTPPGVGVFRKPPVYLAAGDTMVATIEGIGQLRNPVTGERQA